MNTQQDSTIDVTVRDFMAPFPYSVTPDTSVADASYLMRKRRIRHLPVLVDGELVGVVTRTDILAAQPSEAIALKNWEQDDILCKITVQKIMALKPVTVGEDTSLVDAARLMLERRIGCLPIVDNERKLHGLITETDLLQAMVRHWAPSPQKA
ncbi:MAG: CBS domain-containing protein [Gammaproteobacteria bacterium]